MPNISGQPMVGTDIIWVLSIRFSYDVSRPLLLGSAQIWDMPLIGLGQDALEHEISRAPSPVVSRDIGYAFIWAGLRSLKHDISRAPSAGVSPDIGYAFNWAWLRCFRP